MNDRSSLFDDRRFPDLIRQARETLQQRLGEAGARRPISTDEDALLIASALLVDHLHDGLAQLGGRLRAPLLELLGLEPRGSQAARASVRFIFETPLTGTVEIPAGTEVATGPGAAPFTMISPLRVTPNQVTCVDEENGDLLVGLAEPAGDTTVALCGAPIGDGPWESFDGVTWHACRRRPAPRGETWLDIRAHDLHARKRYEAAWLRQRGGADHVRRLGVDSGPAALGALTARTVEATGIVVHARRIADEPLGVSDGTAGQRFRLAEPPTTAIGAEPVVETVTTQGVLAWTPVASFAQTRAGDQHVVMDPVTAEVRFPPAVRRPDGSRAAVGAVPPAGAPVRVRNYWTGGGAAGNVAAGALRELRLVLPGVRMRVENPLAARGGRDAETIDDVWERAPRAMQARDRAVTAADHEELARAADPSLARVRCVPDRPSGAIRVLLVACPPPERADRPLLEDLRPTPAMLTAVTDHLEPRRMLGARLLIESPHYQGVSVDVQVVARRDADRRALRQAVLDALYSYLHPVSGGDDRTGWTFGQAVTASAIRKHLYSLTGVQDLTRLALSPVDAETGAQSPAQPSIALVPTALPLSVDHRVEIAGG